MTHKAPVDAFLDAATDEIEVNVVIGRDAEGARLALLADELK